MIGQRFGKWTVIERAEPRKYTCGRTHTRWLCKCDCGEEGIVFGSALKRGASKMCTTCADTEAGRRPRKKPDPGSVKTMNDPRGPHKGELAGNAVRWINEHPLGLQKAKRAAQKEAREYRDLIRLKCPINEYPPCMSCNDVTVAYCVETGSECETFHAYCCCSWSDEDE